MSEASSHPRKRARIDQQPPFTILLEPSSNINASLCENSTWFEIEKYNPPKDPDTQEGFINLLHTFCTTNRLWECRAETCNRKPELRRGIPLCSSWPGLQEWALQVAACYRSNSSEDSGSMHSLVQALTAHIMYCESIKPGKNRHPQKDSEFIAWENKVMLSEVLEVCSWLCGVCIGEYEFYYPTLERAAVEEEFAEAIVSSLRRIRELRLCPQRIWSIARNSVGGELNLPTLVGSLKTDVWGRDRHEGCSFSQCEDTIKNTTGVTARHECVEKDKCYILTIPEGVLEEATKDGTSTAWSFENRSIVQRHRSLAISHVWSDGTGTGRHPHGTVNQCLYQFFYEKAVELSCDGIWWDTLCLPADNTSRSLAINNMHINYLGAKVTLVHDLYLRNFDFTDAESTCFAVIMSPWFSRGWTALELACSKEVKIIFKGDRIIDLDNEILAKPTSGASPLHQLATTAILGLRQGRQRALGHQENQEILTDSSFGTQASVERILMTLGPRFTSWSKDRAIIAGLFAGVTETAEKGEQKIYRDIVVKARTLAVQHLFHGAETMTVPGFTWCPTDLFRFPLSNTGDTKIIIDQDGTIAGIWRFSCLKDYRTEDFVWDSTHPLSRPAMKLALRMNHDHALLIPHVKHLAKRCLIVKVMWGRRDDRFLRVKLVGFAEFRQTWFKPLPEMSVKVGVMRGLKELPHGVSICHYALEIRRVACRRGGNPHESSEDEKKFDVEGEIDDRDTPNITGQVDDVSCVCNIPF